MEFSLLCEGPSRRSQIGRHDDTPAIAETLARGLVPAHACSNVELQRLLVVGVRRELCDIETGPRLPERTGLLEEGSRCLWVAISPPVNARAGLGAGARLTFGTRNEEAIGGDRNRA